MRPQSPPVPPAALVADLPAEPVVPEAANDWTTADYINALREFGRTVVVRFNSLKAWAVKPPQQ